MNYWLIRKADPGNPGDREILAIASFEYIGRITSSMLKQVDKALNLSVSAWFWEEIYQSEFETYQAFGFNEIKLNGN